MRVVDLAAAVKAFLHASGCGRARQRRHLAEQPAATDTRAREGAGIQGRGQAEGPPVARHLSGVSAAAETGAAAFMAASVVIQGTAAALSALCRAAARHQGVAEGLRGAREAASPLTRGLAAATSDNQCAFRCRAAAKNIRCMRTPAFCGKGRARNSWTIMQRMLRASNSTASGSCVQPNRRDITQATVPSK